MIKKQGISLIVLIVTIIVIIILAAVVILTLTKNNPIESAKEARFKEDIRTFQDELAMTVSKQYANAGGKRDTKINADKYTKDGAEDSVYTYIPSYKDKYNNKFVIQDDELKYTKKLDDNEKEYAKSLNVNNNYILPDNFQQVEYIYCDGNQYIFIPVNENKNYNNIGTKFKIKLTGRSNIWGPEIISSEPHKLIQSYIRIGDFDYKNMMGFAANGRALFPDISYYTDANKTGIGTITDIDMNSKGDRKLFINNKYVSTFKKEYEEIDHADLFCIFASCYELDITKFIGYLYDSLCIYNDGVKRIELYPCYSTTTVTDASGEECTSGTIGMYDTVEGKFYTNQGTGKFDVGPDV